MKMRIYLLLVVEHQQVAVVHSTIGMMLEKKRNKFVSTVFQYALYSRVSTADLGNA
jgi:hypothetical protein